MCSLVCTIYPSLFSPSNQPALSLYQSQSLHLKYLHLYTLMFSSVLLDMLSPSPPPLTSPYSSIVSACTLLVKSTSGGHCYLGLIQSASISFPDVHIWFGKGFPLDALPDTTLPIYQGLKPALKVMFHNSILFIWDLRNSGPCSCNRVL